MKSKTLAILLSLGLPLVVYAEDSDLEEEIPTVPVEVVASDTAREGVLDSSSNIVAVEGKNYLIPIAVSHPNRIVTPFSEPEVVSTSLTGMKADGSCGEICVKDNVVYIATDKETPVTAYITQRGSQGVAISLTMTPKKIPPREIHLSLSETSDKAQIPLGSKKAEKWEKSADYVTTLKKLLRSIALQEVPNGYNSRLITSNTRGTPICKSSLVTTEFVGGQALTGHNFIVYIGVAKNISKAPVEIKETMCGSFDVVAIAAFPNVILQPNEKTEIYVVKKVQYDQPIKNYRPSLLD